VKSTRFTVRLNIKKELKSTVRERIPTVYYSFTKEIGMYAVCGLSLVELKFMPTGVLAGVKTNRSSRLT